jgi:hypothetical protein
MKEMMGEGKPCVENKQIYKYLLEQFHDTELILSASPVAVVGEVSVHFP